MLYLVLFLACLPNLARANNRIEHVLLISVVRHYLNVNARALFIEQVMAGDEIRLRFNNPLDDSRTPDLIVQPV